MLKYNFPGLSVVNVELTSKCNKACWMCGRRKLEKEHPDLCQWEDMPFSLVRKISRQVPDYILIQFHNNGEPLLYPFFREAVDLFSKNIKCVNTNGKLLLEKKYDIISHLDTLTISVIENDSEADEQYNIVKEFIKIKKDRKPYMIYRLLGKIEKKERWYELPGLVATRVLHNPMGSFGYQKEVTIPEHGICLDLLTHLVITTNGDVYPCVRYNPLKYNKLGNINKKSLRQMWTCRKRYKLIRYHCKGWRDKFEFCSKCDYYGCPTGYSSNLELPSVK